VQVREASTMMSTLGGLISLNNTQLTVLRNRGTWNVITKYRPREFGLKLTNYGNGFGVRSRG